METQAFRNILENDSIVRLTDKLAKSLNSKILKNDTCSKLNIKDYIWRALIFDSNTKIKSVSSNQVLLYLLQLKQQTNSDFKSDRLEYLFKELENYAENSQAIIDFLYLLKDSRYKNEDDLSTNIDYDKSFFFLKSKIENKDFGDRTSDLSLFSTLFSNDYMNPNLNFDLPGLNFLSKYNMTKPIEQLHPLNFMSQETKKNVEFNEDLVQKTCEKTLFFSMISKPIHKEITNNIHLDFPELPIDMKSYKWQLPSQENYEWIDYDRLLDLNKKKPYKNFSNDDGFFSKTTSTVTSCYIDNQTQDDIDELWDRALNEQASQYYDWESIDTIYNEYDEQDNKTRLLDAPKHVFDEFYYYYLQTISTLTGTSITRLVIPEYNFMRDCLMVLISLSSNTFYLNTDKFEADESIQISGISSEALNSFCREFAYIGTLHHNLLKLIDKPKKDNRCGSVFRSFINSLQEYLKYYHSSIINIIDDSIDLLTPTKMYAKLKPLMDQIRFLGEICMLESDVSCPKGINLVFHLYNVSKQCSNNLKNYSLVIYLLKKSLKPFLKFIESWIYKGRFSDIFDEFIIDIDRNSIARRDIYYWKNGYRLKSKFAKSNEEELELFKGLYEKIFNCGQTLGLLKICIPNHFLCVYQNANIRLSINLNISHLNSLSYRALEYKRNIISQNKISFRTRIEYLEDKLKEEQELHEKAKLENERQAQLMRQKREEEARVIAERKQRDLNYLKEEKEREAERRKQEKLRERKENQEYIEKVTKREFELMDTDDNLKEQIKQEMIEEYDQLMKDAESRQKIALEKISQAKSQIQQDQRNISNHKDNMSLKGEEQNENSEDEPMDVSMQQLDSSNIIPMDIEMGEYESDKAESTHQSPEVKTHIKIIPSMHHSVESAQTDNDESSRKIDLFKSKNTYGHASDSTLQNLIYGEVGIDEHVIKTHIKTFQKHDSRIESTDEARLATFRNRNSHGHSSDSQIQNLLYNNSKIIAGDVKEKNPKETSPKTYIKLIVGKHSADETRTETIDAEAKHKTEVFKNKNTHGHSSDSTIQSLLYYDTPKIPKVTFIANESPKDQQTQNQEYSGHFSDSTIQNLLNNGETESIKSRKETCNDTLNETYTQYQLNKTERERNKQRNEELNNSNLLIEHKYSVKMNPNQHVSKSSLTHNFGMNYLDDEIDQKNLIKLKFLENQTYDWEEIFKSTVVKYEEKFEFDSLMTNLLNKESLNNVYSIAKYDDIFDDDNDSLNDDYLFNENGDNCPQVFVFNYLNLEEIIGRSIIPFIEVQNEIVNRAFMNYTLFDLKLDVHLLELRRFFFFENGDFSKLFIFNLCKHLFSNDITISTKQCRLEDVFNPMYINEAFNSALSTIKSKFLNRLSIKINLKLKDEKKTHKSSSLVENHYYDQILDYLSCLELNYRVDWPLNLLITEASIKKYNLFFAFMLQIKFCIESLNTASIDLKRVSVIHRGCESSHMKYVKILIFEMEHFLNALQNYLFQVVNSTWFELQENLNHKAKSFNDLRDIHNSFLNNTLFRSLFTEKTARILKIIKSLLSCILLFRFQLQNDIWIRNNQTNELEFKSYTLLTETNNSFKNLFRFLFSVLKSSVSMNEQSHLKYLEASLNFNNFYK